MLNYGYEVKDGYFKGEVLDSQFGVVFDVDFEFLPTDLQIAICRFAQDIGVAGNPEYTMEHIAHLYQKSWQLEKVEQSPTIDNISNLLELPQRNWSEII